MSLTGRIEEQETRRLAPKSSWVKPSTAASNQAAGRYTRPRAGRHRAPEFVTPEASPVADTAVFDRPAALTPRTPQLPPTDGAAYPSWMRDQPVGEQTEVIRPGEYPAVIAGGLPFRAPGAAMAAASMPCSRPLSGSRLLVRTLVESLLRVRAGAVSLLRPKRGGQ
ncbi:hypothetical protein Ade02nite_18930 [Paractinoplanes deccanensis]|uniref:Uncharacterized protein n=1 Tax=Paractinoplanes deccanensis TaxID=113561 RepID=A0ABQ3XZX9_9ACTN|nr:hypothetical protein [Actinoplanes deccanensis]GID73252.1 hypothetical protein Ade02nite_18930 [Actinoplanes deccanensis]